MGTEAECGLSGHGLGGFAGAISRYAVALWIGERWGRSFPLGTLVVNVSGCFLIGLLMSLFLEKYPW